MDAKTDELRDAHDALAEVYASRLAHVMDQLPADRAVLGMFCDLVLGNGAGAKARHTTESSGRRWRMGNYPWREGDSTAPDLVKPRE